MRRVLKKQEAAQELASDLTERTTARILQELAAAPQTGLRPEHDYSGDVVTVEWGEENFSPVPYNGFRVGPFAMTTKIRQGETVSDAITRANAALADSAKISFQHKLACWLESYNEANGILSR